MKRNVILVVGTIFIFSAVTVSAKNISAKTEDGNIVILKDDGTWKYSNSSKNKKSRNNTVNTKSNNALTEVKGKGNLSVWYDSKVWKKSNDDSARITFECKGEDVYAMAISERMAIPLDSLKKIALNNALEAAPDAEIVFEERRLVNGKELLVLHISGTIEGIEFIYYGYYFTDKAGSYQLLTYTSKNLFTEYENKMTNFLNGFVVN